MIDSRFLIFVITALLLASCGERDDRGTAPPPSGVEQEFEGKFSLARSQKGYTRWRLDAKSARFLESGQVKVEDVDLVIFGDKRGETVTVYGNKGEVNQGTFNVKITGDVVATFSGGGRLTAEEIYWSDSEKKIYTLPGTKVTIVYKDSTVVGEELNAWPETETVRLKNVTGVTRVEEK